MKGVLATLDVFTLDLGILRVGCVVELEPFDTFLMRVFSIGLFVLSIGLLHCVVACLHRGTFRSTAPLQNSLGLLFASFYIGITRVTLTPFECVGHPEGRSSLVAFMTVLCGSLDHTRMVVVGVVVLVLFPGCFLAHSAWLTHIYPEKVRQQDLHFLRASAYLFRRFKRHDFALFLLARNLLCACSPVFESDAKMVLILTLSLLVSLSVQGAWRPWRAPFMNRLDAVVTYDKGELSMTWKSSQVKLLEQLPAAKKRRTEE